MTMSLLSGAETSPAFLLLNRSNIQKKLLILHQKIKSINSCLLWRAQLSKSLVQFFPKCVVEEPLPCLSLFSSVLPQLHSTTSTISYPRRYPIPIYDANATYFLQNYEQNSKHRKKSSSVNKKWITVWHLWCYIYNCNYNKTTQAMLHTSYYYNT